MLRESANFASLHDDSTAFVAAHNDVQTEKTPVMTPALKATGLGL